MVQRKYVSTTQYLVTEIPFISYTKYFNDHQEKVNSHIKRIEEDSRKYGIDNPIQKIQNFVIGENNSILCTCIHYLTLDKE